MVQDQQENRQTAPVFPYNPRYFHNPELLREDMEQFHAQRKHAQTGRGIRKLLFAVLFLLFANLSIAVWYFLRFRGILP